MSPDFDLPLRVPALAALVLALACQRTGGNGHVRDAGVGDAGVGDAPAVQDVGVGVSDDSAADAAVEDASSTAVDATLPKPDLVITEITRDTYYFHVRYCNVGSTGSPDMFGIRVEDVATGDHFDSNPLYPYAVPATGACEVSGGFTCELIGVNCAQTVSVRATADPFDTVDEADELNNAFTQPF